MSFSYHFSFIIIFILSSISLQSYGNENNPTQHLIKNENIHCVHPIAKKDRAISDEVWCGINDGSSQPSVWFGTYGDSQLNFMPWLSEGQSIGGMSVSDSGKYLAIIHVGEGHPYLIMYDIDKTRHAKDDRYVYTFNPYPGSVGLVRWEGDKLLIETDYPVGKKSVEEEDLSKSFLTYRVDIKEKNLIPFHHK